MVTTFQEIEELAEFCTSDKQQEYLRELMRHGGNAAQTARALGVHKDTVSRCIRRLKKRAVERGWSPDHDMHKTVPMGYHIRGISTLYGKKGEVTAQWVKSQKNKEEIDLQELEDALKDRFERVVPLPVVAAPTVPLKKDLLPIYVLSDAHLGLYAWGEESGEDWGLDIAQRMIVGAVKHLIDAAPAADEALIINLGDFTHTDNFMNKTPKGGHPQDADGRWPELVAVGIDAFVSCIDFALAKHRIVHVISKAGNHDMHTGIMLNLALMQAYKDNPRVVFDKTYEAFSYFRFGKVLIGATHGDNRIKPAELPLIMATDRSVDWGDSQYRYWYTGHLHHQRKFEPTGGDCTVETFRIMARRDAWHQKSGYRAGREMQSIIMHRNYGETGRTVVTPDMLREVV